MRYCYSNRKSKTKTVNAPVIGLYLTLWVQFGLWLFDYKNYNYELAETITNAYYFILLPYCLFLWNRLSSFGKSTVYCLVGVVVIDLVYYCFGLSGITQTILLVVVLLGNIIYGGFKKIFSFCLVIVEKPRFNSRGFFMP